MRWVSCLLKQLRRNIKITLLDVSTHRVSVSGGRNSLDLEVIAEELGSHIIDIQNAVT